MNYMVRVSAAADGNANAISAPPSGPPRGIVRMLDLALGIDGAAARNFFLVAPDDREDEVRAQFARPAFSRVAELNLRYPPYSELRDHRASIGRFGQGWKGILAISRAIAPQVKCHEEIPCVANLDDDPDARARST